MLKVSRKEIFLKSEELSQSVQVSLFLPPGFSPNRHYPLLVLNDGQDMDSLQMDRILSEVYKHNIACHFVLAAIHAGENRLQIYGVAGIPDYKKRGNLAKSYADFVVNKVIPEVLQTCGLNNFRFHVMGGFSLGGLSAFDIAWNHPQIFSAVMASSASFWWRSKDLKAGYTDNDRIMHKVVRETPEKPTLKVWLQSGTLDETADRNGNGVIDSIDDMLDLVQELKKHGFKEKEDLIYHEVIGGKHTLETYGMVLPYFLQWVMKSS